MVNKKIIKILLIIIAASFSLFSQEKNQINQKKGELFRIKDEISSLENKIKIKNKKERESYGVLDNYNKQSYLLHTLITKLKHEEQLKESQIAISEKNISGLQEDINKLRENYSKYVVSIYKHGSEDEWASILDADSFEQALLRYKYLKRFSERRINDLEEFNKAKDSLIVIKVRLVKEKKDKAELTLQKQSEENNLEVKKKERKSILRSIRNDKNALLSELSAKKNAEIKIRNLINKLIEEAERRRKADEARMAAEKTKAFKGGKELAAGTETSSGIYKEYDIDLSTAGFSSFASLKGRLNWPVRSGRIVKKFGENRNQRLNTVTLNYGIDIKTLPEANVISVAEGVVSAIDWLPGYGSVIIITHKGDFRTVYSHLSNIFVKEGDKVKLGTIIGQVGESLEGNILHFEIWNSRDKQNPENWLARK